MKTITLIRHGKPEACKRYPLMSIVSGSDIKKFIDAYNNCDLVDTFAPQYLRDALNMGGFFISSNLKRARDSFGLLKVDSYVVSDLFVEAELPSGILEKLKMPLFIWTILLRIIWYFGFTKKCESFVKFKERMKNARVFLLEKSEKNDKVIVMAHGFVNSTLEKELLNDNWARVDCKNGNKFFSYKKFSKSRSN